MQDPDLKLIVLDEINIALRYDYLPLAEVVETLKARRRDLHVVVTGRNAKRELIEAADLVTEMTLVKHHFAAGVKAQAGISTDDRARPHAARHGVERRQVAARRGTLPCAREAQTLGQAVQAAEHVEQRRRHSGGRGDRQGAGAAALAACLPSVHMNPVLLKPQSDVGAQVSVQGKVLGRATAREMQGLKPKLMPYVLQSFAKLKQEAHIVLVEGAGSASEINLRKNDIANMGFARAADVPVVVIGDIDRGGVIASLVGTKEVLDPEDAKLVAGFVVNRMRGDVSLFADGMAEIAKRTGWPALGLVPFFEGARLPAEDAYDLIERRLSAAMAAGWRCRSPHIANFDDLDPLSAEPDVDVVMVKQGHPLPVCDLIVLPGSKATIADLGALRAQGWDIDIAAHVRRGGHVLGLCGGYQMLGRAIADPDGDEGPSKVSSGLGLLAVETTIRARRR
jgi:adenosylcobyric acid synthase